jgi:hypothetical protein
MSKIPLATSRAGKIQQILSVYALAEDPNPQNHRTKNQHLPVPARFAQPAKSSAVTNFKANSSSSCAVRSNHV